MENAPCFGGVLAAASGQEVRWVGQNAGMRSDFCKNYSLVQTLLSLRLREPSRAGRVWVLQTRGRSGQITSPFSLSFPAPQEDV